MHSLTRFGFGLGLGICVGQRGCEHGKQEGGQHQTPPPPPAHEGISENVPPENEKHSKFLGRGALALVLDNEVKVNISRMHSQTVSTVRQNYSVGIDQHPEPLLKIKCHVQFHHCMTMHFAKVANSSKKYKFAKFAIEMSTKPRTTLGDRCRPYARHFSPNNSGEVGEAEKNLGHINLAR